MEKIPMATPGEILNEEFIKAYGITVYRLAHDTGMSQTHVWEIIRGKRRITFDTALRLAKYLDTSVEFWMNVQSRYDFRNLDKHVMEQIAEIPTIKSVLKTQKKGIKKKKD